MEWLLLLTTITLFLQIWTGGFCQETVPCQPGFSSDNFVFTVHRERLHRGKILGRVDFDICTDQNTFLFICDDNRFKVEMDGTIKVKHDIKLHHGRISFSIHGWHSVGKKMTSRVTVEYQRPHHTGHEMNDQTESQNIQMFPHPSSGLKRHKRWVIDHIHIDENLRGPFPKEVKQVQSSKWRESIIHYSITGEGADLPPVGLFIIDKDSGMLLVTETLDREKQSKYLLTVHATLRNGNAAEDPETITIIVEDQNDNKPEFISNTFVGNVSEGSHPGTSVMTVTATDKDDPTTDNGMFKFSVLSQTPPVPYPEMFTIDQDTGTIRVISAGLDREKLSEYTLMIKVADKEGTGLSSTATASITVLDQNDNAPQFNPTNYIQNVPENAVDFEVVRLIVTDDDEPHTPTWNAKYRIVTGNDGGEFGITTDPDNNNGIVKTIKGLDFEAKQQYILLITVENEVPFSTPSPTSTATLTVTVEDVNEAPIFSPPTLSVPVKEDVPLNTFIATYQAKDPDIEMKQTVSYYIDDPAGWLNVDKESVTITVKQAMDRESPFVKNDKYTSLIYAYDNANHPATGTGTLVLLLEDVNDNGPVVDVVGDVHFCNQDPPPQEFSVVDPDSIRNAGPFRAELLREARRNWAVSMNDTENKIILSMATQLPPAEYHIIIRAYDNGNNYQDTTLKVTVCNCTGDEIHCHKAGNPATGWPIILASLGVVLALLIVLLLLWLRKMRKVKKETFLPEDDDDNRGSLINYNEEGGGEEDNTEYNLRQLHRGLDARPRFYRDDVEPSMMPAPKYLPRPANPDDIIRFVEDNLKMADNDPTVPPYDSLLVFHYEGTGSEAGSLSSLNSDSSEGDQDFDFLNQWGPRFKKLADMYGGEED